MGECFDLREETKALIYRGHLQQFVAMKDR